MNASEFDATIRVQVQDAATQDVMSALDRPAGRRPDPRLVALSQSFNGLAESDRSRVREVAAMARHAATFGMLAILDGVRVIDSGSGRGTLELRHADDNQSVLLNNPDGPFLHDLLNQE